MKEALIQIKQELGEDAIILKTNHVPGRLFASGDVEVTAAKDEDISSPHQAFAPLRVANTTLYNKARKVVSEMPQQPAGNAHTSTSMSAVDRRKLAALQKKDMDDNQDVADKKYASIQSDISELKTMFRSVMKSGETPAAAGFSGEWAIVYKKLVDAEVDADTAKNFVNRIHADMPETDADAIKRFVNELSSCFIASNMMKRPEGRPYVVMFVGPTGAGKTTTLAKLAAHYSLARSKSITVMTADTYRIAAIEQIRTFTDIMNMPLHVVFTPQEAQETLAACNAHDMVFVDTAGRSQKSTEHLDELHSFIHAIMPDEIHLVLSAGTKTSDLTSIISQYKKLGVNRLLFTKLDETIKLGNVFTAGISSRIPFSFFTFGQRVPDDIELAQSHRLVQRMFEGSIL